MSHVYISLNRFIDPLNQKRRDRIKKTLKILAICGAFLTPVAGAGHYYVKSQNLARQNDLLRQEIARQMSLKERP